MAVARRTLRWVGILLLLFVVALITAGLSRWSELVSVGIFGATPSLILVPTDWSIALFVPVLLASCAVSRQRLLVVALLGVGMQVAVQIWLTGGLLSTDIDWKGAAAQVIAAVVFAIAVALSFQRRTRAGWALGSLAGGLSGVVSLVLWSYSVGALAIWSMGVLILAISILAAGGLVRGRTIPTVLGVLAGLCAIPALLWIGNTPIT